jgi:hypothetical protein
VGPLCPSSSLPPMAAVRVRGVARLSIRVRVVTTGRPPTEGLAPARVRRVTSGRQGRVSPHGGGATT